ncbi:MAG: hypothetical protein IPK05_13170 [Comamonadaceae bacterium]|nr:hypothetical protein [Comamonadaceae bacterium]
MEQQNTPIRTFRSSTSRASCAAGRQLLASGALAGARGRAGSHEHGAQPSADITDNIAWAELDPDLFALLRQPEALDALGEHGQPLVWPRLAGLGVIAA